MNAEEAVLGRAEVEAGADEDRDDRQAGKSLHQPGWPFDLELELLPLARRGRLELGSVAGEARHAVHFAFASCRECREVELAGLRKLQLRRIPLDLRTRWTRAERGRPGRADGRRWAWRPWRCIELHFERDVVSVGEVELDGPSTMHPFGTLEIVAIHEVVPGDGEIFLLAGYRQIGVERNRRRDVGSHARRRKVGVGERHRQVGLVT